MQIDYQISIRFHNIQAATCARQVSLDVDEFLRHTFFFLFWFILISNSSKFPISEMFLQIDDRASTTTSLSENVNFRMVRFIIFFPRSDFSFRQLLAWRCDRLLEYYWSSAKDSRRQFSWFFLSFSFQCIQPSPFIFVSPIQNDNQTLTHVESAQGAITRQVSFDNSSSQTPKLLNAETNPSETLLFSLLFWFLFQSTIFLKFPPTDCPPLSGNDHPTPSGLSLSALWHWEFANKFSHFSFWKKEPTSSLAGPFPFVERFPTRHSPMVFMFESQVVTSDAQIDGVGLACVTGESYVSFAHVPRAPHHGPGMRYCNLLLFSCAALGLKKSCCIN